MTTSEKRSAEKFIQQNPYPSTFIEMFDILVAKNWFDLLREYGL